MSTVSLVSGIVEDFADGCGPAGRYDDPEETAWRKRIRLTCWAFSAEKAAATESFAGWLDAHIYEAPVPDGTVLTEQQSGFGAEWFARLPGGKLMRAVDFAPVARRVL